MGTRYRFSAYDEDRVLRAVTEAVTTGRFHGSVISLELLALEDVGLQASGWQRPTPREIDFVRGVVADAVATREAEAFR